MIDYDLITSKGERGVNEDSVRIIDKGDMKVFVLADGLGGQGHGDVASAAAVSAVEKYARENDFDDNFLNNCFVIANEGVMDAQLDKDYFDMRTTLVILVIVGEKAYCGHVGDSRLYIFKNNKYVYRTPDHSVTQALKNMGEIKEEEIRFHPDRNRLLKALGSPLEEGDVLFDNDASDVDVKNKDFLLSSDGFWEWIVEKDMQKCLLKYNDAHICLKNMSNIALKNGFSNGMDNLSAVLVRCR